MFATPTQFTEFQKSQIDALHALSNVAFQATERLVDLNLAAVKAAMEESAATAQTLFSAKDPQELAAVGSTLAQPALHKLVGYSTNVYNILSSASADLRRVVETQMAEGNGKAAEMIEFATRNAPAGSESAMALWKNSLTAYNTAYDTFSKAARQAFDTAESNFNAATRNAAAAVTPAPEIEVVKSRSKKGE